MGLYGDNGVGIGDRDNVMDKMDIISGILGKVFGVIGGYIVVFVVFVDNVRSYGLGFIFIIFLLLVIVNFVIIFINILVSDEGRRLREKY